MSLCTCATPNQHYGTTRSDKTEGKEIPATNHVTGATPTGRMAISKSLDCDHYGFVVERTRPTRVMSATPKVLNLISLKSKYRNVPTVADGIRFSSSAEAGRYVFLSALQKSGEISDLRLQVTFVVAPSVRLIGSKRKTPALRYVADFTYRNASGRLIVEDVKGQSPRCTKSNGTCLHCRV